MTDRARAIARCHGHIAEVREALPAERLPVFSADRGWQPLCDFIGVPVPDPPIPKVNELAAITQNVARMTRGASAILAGSAALVAGLDGTAAVMSACWRASC